MARKILCEPCHNLTKKAAEKYGEVYEFIKGCANKEGITCDDCGINIEPAIAEKSCPTCHQAIEGTPKGDTCFAVVLVESRTVPGYERQKPEKWASAYLDEFIMCKNCSRETLTVECEHCGHNNNFTA